MRRITLRMLGLKTRDRRSRAASPASLGFTLVELLVVVAVIAILAALLFPVFASVRKKARQIDCGSNQRQLGIAISQYVQDNDDAFPWSFSLDDKTTWPGRVSPYVKTYELTADQAGIGGVMWCHEAVTRRQALSTNGQVIGLLDTRHRPPTPTFYGSVVSLARIEAPADIVLLGDAILNDHVPADRVAAMEFAYPHPANRRDHTADADWSATWNGLGTNNKHVAWRHQGGANFFYVDGHAKWVKQGTLKDSDWDVRCKPGAGCDNGGPYPAPDGTCGSESPINCR